MKKIFMTVALLTGVLMLPVLNATTNKGAELETITVEGKQAVCEADDSANDVFNCTVKVGSNEESVNIMVHPKEGASLDTTSSEKIRDAITLIGNTTTLDLTVEKDEDTTITNTYKLTITRVAKPRLNSLKVLATTIDGVEQTLSFNPETLQYTLEVENDITNVFVKPTVEAGKGLEITTTLTNGAIEVEDLGTSYADYVYITVKNELDEEVEYEIAISRKASQLAQDIETELGAGHKVTDFIGRDGVGETGKEYIAIVVEETLTSGLVITKGYLIEKTADLDTTKAVAKFNDIKTKPATLMEITNLYDNDYVLDEEALNAIKADGGKVTIYSYSAYWTIDGSKIPDDMKELDLKVFTGEDVEETLRNKLLSLVGDKDKALPIDFAYSGNLPEGTKISLFVDPDKFGEEDLVLYYYDKTTGKLKLVSKKLNINEYGLVELELDHLSSYVLTTASNNAETGPMNIVLYLLLAVSSLAGIVFLSKKKNN